MKENINLSKYAEIKRIYESCIKEDENERPPISELLLGFFNNCYSEIQKENNKIHYYSLASNQNYP